MMIRLLPSFRVTSSRYELKQPQRGQKCKQLDAFGVVTIIDKIDKQECSLSKFSEAGVVGNLATGAVMYRSSQEQLSLMRPLSYNGGNGGLHPSAITQPPLQPSVVLRRPEAGVGVNQQRHLLRPKSDTEVLRHNAAAAAAKQQSNRKENSKERKETNKERKKREKEEKQQQKKKQRNSNSQQQQQQQHQYQGQMKPSGPQQPYADSYYTEQQSQPRQQQQVSVQRQSSSPSAPLNRSQPNATQLSQNSGYTVVTSSRALSDTDTASSPSKDGANVNKVRVWLRFQVHMYAYVLVLPST